jgi:anti-sigma factor RsiW
MTHPTTDLLAHLRGELTPAEHERVTAHLAGCAECRREQAAFRTILTGLAVAPAPVEEPHWGRYRAELHEKLDARRARSRGLWWRPLPWALSGAAVAALAIVLWLGGQREPGRQDFVALEEAAIGGRLELLQQYRTVERLDMLEDLDVIGQLDRLAPPSES